MQVTRPRTNIIGAMNGSTDWQISRNFSLNAVLAPIRLSPIGSVIQPISRLITMMMPKWIGSMPCRLGQPGSLAATNALAQSGDFFAHGHQARLLLEAQLVPCDLACNDGSDVVVKRQICDMRSRLMMADSKAENGGRAPGIH